MLVFSVVIISGLDNQNTEVPDVYNIFRPPYWCTTEAHQDDVFIRGRGGGGVGLPYETNGDARRLD